MGEALDDRSFRTEINTSLGAARERSTVFIRLSAQPQISAHLE